jgi:dynein heavy chain
MVVSGGTGTGKTRVVMTELLNTCNNADNNKSFVPIAFSAQTSVFDLQNQLEGFIPQRLGKVNSFTTFGPAEGKQGIVFIDDINLPQKEKYNAQSPLELIRQWMDYQGWFNLLSDDKEFQKYDKISFSGTFGPLRNVMTPRLVRHFCQIYLNA